MGRNPNVDELTEEIALERVRAIALKQHLELDSETELLVKHIIAGGFVGGIGKFVGDRDWALNQAIRFWGNEQHGPTKQKAFEHICELVGLTGQQRNNTSQLVDVVIDTLKAK